MPLNGPRSILRRFVFSRYHSVLDWLRGPATAIAVTLRSASHLDFRLEPIGLWQACTPFQKNAAEDIVLRGSIRCSMCRSRTVVEIAEAVEAILQLFGPPVAHQPGAAGNPPAPHKMGSYIAVPTRSAKSAPKSVIRISLDLRDAGVDFAAGPLAFDIAPPIVGAELEGKAPVIKTEGLRVGRYRGCQNSGRGQTN